MTIDIFNLTNDLQGFQPVYWSDYVAILGVTYSLVMKTSTVFCRDSALALSDSRLREPVGSGNLSMWAHECLRTRQWVGLLGLLL